MIKAAGYETVRTIDVSWNSASAKLYYLKVLPVADDTTVWWLRAEMTGMTTLFKNVVRYRRFLLAFRQGVKA